MSARHKTGRFAQAWRMHARRRDEGGIVLVYFTLALVVIFGMAAFAVDIGSWQLRAAQLQRAADAASLAGVVYMPGNIAEAQAIADKVAADNGVPAGDITVKPTGNPHQLSVTVNDPNVPTYFSRIFGIDSIAETRTAVAEYQGPIPLGSPENSFGTGNLSLGAGSPTNIWAAVNGYCTSQENGDEYLSQYDAIWSKQSNSYVCPASPASVPVPGPPYVNSVYNPAGYYYDIVSPVTQQIAVQLYDPSYEPKGCSNGSTSPDSALGGGNTTITTNYTLWYSPVPLDHSQDQEISTVQYGTGDAASCGQWATPAPLTFTATAGAEYRLQVATQQGQANSNGSNSYGVRLAVNGSFTRCSTVTTVAWYSATCPVVHGESALSVYANQPGGVATFDLAQVDAEYAGHTMEITLFDPGEGSHYIQVIDPSGNPVAFTYQTVDTEPGDSAPDNATVKGFSPISGSTTGTPGMDVSPTVTPPPGIVSNSKFNDRLVQLTVTIPGSYTAPNGGWWSIKYTATNNVTDRTTWSVALLGDPIHLVQ